MFLVRLFVARERGVHRPLPGWLLGFLAVVLWAVGATSAQDRKSEPDVLQKPNDSPGPPAPGPVDQEASAKKAEKKTLPYPFKDPFYNNDFSYVEAPGYVPQDPFDSLKRIPLTCRSKLDIGAQYQARMHHEENLRLDGRDNDFLLEHTRLYGDLRVGERLRFYAESIDATSSFERLPPRGSEENRFDAINLFGDARLWKDETGGEMWARVGRQEMDYGNQRLIASAPWSNTRVTFDGARLLWTSKSWNVDALWVRPVPLTQHVNNDHNFDHWDESQQLYGLYATWHELKDQVVDLYYLGLQEDDALVASHDGVLGGFDANTFGSRWKGKRQQWLWEVEGAFQFGTVSNDRQTGGFVTAGFAHVFEKLPWKPTFWTYYDWASGDADPANGQNGTFNQLIPQTHAFLGLTDIVGRQNIKDLNFQLIAKPHDKVTVVGEWHILNLAQARDALYNNAGLPSRRDLTGAAGTEVGQELDVAIKMRLNRHTDLSFTYCYFFAGDYLAKTGIGADAEFFYAWFTFKF